MNIQQFRYIIKNGSASACAHDYKNIDPEIDLVFPLPQFLPCSEAGALSSLVEDLIEKNKDSLPLTTISHLRVEHIKPSNNEILNQEQWFAIAEAFVRLSKIDGRSSANHLAWKNTLERCWKIDMAPSALTDFFLTCPSGAEVLDVLCGPDNSTLATVCLLLVAPDQKIDFTGANKDSPAIKFSVTWKKDTLSARFVYTKISHNKISTSPLTGLLPASLTMHDNSQNKSFEDLSLSIFKYKEKWLEKSSRTFFSPKDYQAREFAPLRHNQNPTNEIVATACNYLISKAGFSPQEIIENELANINKKENILTRRLFEVILDGNWTGIFSQIEMLQATGYKGCDLAKYIVEGFTNSGMLVDENTQQVNLTTLPTLSF